jgi:hypothetical protein
MINQKCAIIDALTWPPFYSETRTTILKTWCKMMAVWSSSTLMCLSFADKPGGDLISFSKTSNLLYIVSGAIWCVCCFDGLKRIAMMDQQIFYKCVLQIMHQIGVLCLVELIVTRYVYQSWWWSSIIKTFTISLQIQ